MAIKSSLFPPYNSIRLFEKNQLNEWFKVTEKCKLKLIDTQFTCDNMAYRLYIKFETNPCVYVDFWLDHHFYIVFEKLSPLML